MKKRVPDIGRASIAANVYKELFDDFFLCIRYFNNAK